MPGVSSADCCASTPKPTTGVVKSTAWVVGLAGAAGEVSGDRDLTPGLAPALSPELRCGGDVSAAVLSDGPPPASSDTVDRPPVEAADALSSSSAAPAIARAAAPRSECEPPPPVPPAPPRTPPPVLPPRLPPAPAGAPSDAARPLAADAVPSLAVLPLRPRSIDSGLPVTRSPAPVLSGRANGRCLCSSTTPGDAGGVTGSARGVYCSTSCSTPGIGDPSCHAPPPPVQCRCGSDIRTTLKWQAKPRPL